VIPYLGLAGLELGVIKQANALIDHQFDISIIYINGYEEKTFSVISPDVLAEYNVRTF